MMRRLPKFGCGVRVGICTTLVAGVETILSGEDSARVLEPDRYQPGRIYTARKALLLLFTERLLD